MTSKRYLPILAALIAGCSSAPSYTGPSGSGTPATIEKFGSAFSLCGLTVAFTKDPICDARVLMVDGQQTSMWAASIEVSPGQRTLGLICSAAFGPAPSDKRWSSATYTVDLEPGGKYRIEAAWDGNCRMRLVDAKTKKVVSGDSAPDFGQRNRQDAVGQAVAAGQVLGDDFLQLRVPNSGGWVRINAGSGTVALARRGSQPGETFAAQVILFGLKSTDSIQELTTLIQQGAERDTPAERFAMLSSKFEPNISREYPCVRHDGVYEDRKAKTSPSTTETLTLQASALYCRHPQQTGTGFAAIYSHRGAKLHPTFASEADAFIESVLVPKGAQPDGQPAAAR